MNDYTEEQIAEWREKADLLDEIIGICETEMGGENDEGEWERHDIDDIDFEDIGIQIAQKLGY